ncbi:hypothetical protein RhiJN_19611 [Ceratobasidium sp. AG-Ba]|nr:hypothetical protein RhiJN_19611 [Ceratobasidium sp. AG-Ba]
MHVMCLELLTRRAEERLAATHAGGEERSPEEAGTLHIFQAPTRARDPGCTAAVPRGRWVGGAPARPSTPDAQGGSVDPPLPNAPWFCVTASRERASAFQGAVRDPASSPHVIALRPQQRCASSLALLARFVCMASPFALHHLFVWPRPFRCIRAPRGPPVAMGGSPRTVCAYVSHTFSALRHPRSHRLRRVFAIGGCTSPARTDVLAGLPDPDPPTQKTPPVPVRAPSAHRDMRRQPQYCDNARSYGTSTPSPSSNRALHSHEYDPRLTGLRTMWARTRTATLVLREPPSPLKVNHTRLLSSKGTRINSTWRTSSPSMIWRTPRRCPVPIFSNILSSAISAA